MNKNMCFIDRAGRMALGIALLLGALLYPPIASNVMILSVVLVFAAMNIVSAAIGSCMVYSAVGISSLSNSTDEAV